MDYFQTSTAAAGSSSKPVKAEEQPHQASSSSDSNTNTTSSDANPFSFSVSSMRMPAPSSRLVDAGNHDGAAATAPALSAPSAAAGATAMKATVTTAKGDARPGASNNVGFREALMRRQGSSPSSFFASAQTPGVMAHPLRASVSSSGAVGDDKSAAAAPSWHRESSSSKSSSNEPFDATLPPPGHSTTRSTSTWIGKSPRSPSGLDSLDASAGAPSSNTANTSNSFFGTTHFSSLSSSSSSAAAPLHRSATNFSDARLTDSPQVVSQPESSTSTSSSRPPIKSLSSSSSSSTASTRTVRDASSQSGFPLAISSLSTDTSKLTSDTATQSSISTSPTHQPPSFFQPPQSSSSSAAPLAQRSCPVPSLRMPSLGGSLAGKLPSGACASMASRASSLGVKTGMSRAFNGGAAVSRKGPEIVQNPRFKVLSVGEELKNTLSLPASDSEQQSRHKRKEDVLVLDLRPHTAFVGQGRLLHSINICVPSTLLRRPTFALSKIAETISSRRDQTHFNEILDVAVDGSKGKGTKVLILDQETLLLSQESMIHSLMSKIEKVGYEGDIFWIKGGWNAIQRNIESDDSTTANNVDLSEVVDMNLLNEDEDEEEEDEDEEMSGANDGEVEEESSSTDDLAGSEMSDFQNSRTPRQPFPAAMNGISASESTNNGSGGAYFQNYLQGPRAPGGKGRSSQSSFTSTASSDSLFPSSIASSQSSMSAMGENKDRGNSTSPVGPQFDTNKLQLPHIRPSTSPSGLASSASSSSYLQAPKTRNTLLSASTSASSTTASSKTRSTSAGGACSIIRPKNLPMAAFQYNSTAQGASGDSPQKNTSSSRPTTSQGKGHFQMGLDNNHNASIGRLPGSIGMEKSRSTGRAPFSKKTAANPFFDNIRQNIESASIDHVLEHVAPFEIPPEFTQESLVRHLPEFLKSLIDMPPKERAEKLHKEYFDIEQAEQRRLQKVLDWHCQQSVVVDLAKVEIENKKKEEAKKKGADDMETDEAEKTTYHPFSISAGVEKGHLNRYKNMWPYEHARVRLDSIMSPTCGDYINASHIQLRGTTKRYIASQGPLEQTTEHFWRLVLQENVHVIVMLTLLQEGGRDKCSNYFQTATYGDVQVTLVEEKGSEEAMKKSVCKDFGFFSIDEEVPAVDSPASTEPKTAQRGDQGSKEPFYASTPTQASDSVSSKRYSIQTPSGRSQMQGRKRSLSRRLDSAIVRRTIELRRLSDPPNTPPKTVRHIQYIKWPDFDIPPDPNVVIDLISETNRAQRDLADIAGDEPPVLVHCSAGVGRTGTFIAVDTLLERYRRERRAARASGSPSNGPPRARVRRSGSDFSSSLSLKDLSLNAESTAPAAVAPADSTEQNDPQLKRPSAIRSTSSQESPRHLQAHLGIKELLPEDHSDPILSLVNQMREQRMSSVANAGQYIFTYLALLAGISQELAEEGITAVSPVA